jgi:quercetin dioxygenase-like cupin family protein
MRLEGKAALQGAGDNGSKKNEPAEVVMFTKADSRGYRDVLDGVKMKTLAHGERTLLAEFLIQKGAVIPVHQHPNEQTGYLVSGALRFTIEDEVLVAHPGDSWNLASELPHGAEALEDCVVVEVFSPVREDYLP